MINFVIFLISLIVATNASSDERRLRKDLFDGFDSEVRPVDHEDYAVNLTLDVALFQIIQLNEKDQTLEISAWLRQTWYDHQLTWDPAEYGGIKQVNVVPGKVWLPDTVLYNSVAEDNDMGGNLDKLHTRIMIHSSGRIQWTATAILKTHCGIKVRYFPFDSQHCMLKFVSWTYAIPLLDIIPYSDTMDTVNYETNSEWRLTATSTSRKQKEYSCCEDAYADITFHMHITRRSLFYLLNLVFPISVITLLTILSFLLPAESGERISLAVTLLLAVTVFMLIVAETTPATSQEIPLVSLYFIISMIDMVTLMITVCYVNRLHHKQQSDGDMGDWTRRFILEKLSYMVGIRSRTQHQHSGDSAKNFLMTTEVTNSNGFSGRNNISPVSTQQNMNKDLNLYPNILSNDTKELAKLIQTIGENLNQRIDSILQKVGDADRDELIKTEWRIVAMTVDRCLLIFFLLNFVFTLIGVFSLSPGYVT